MRTHKSDAWLKKTAAASALPSATLSFVRAKPQRVITIRSSPLPRFGTVRKFSGMAPLELWSAVRLPSEHPAGISVRTAAALAPSSASRKIDIGADTRLRPEWENIMHDPNTTNRPSRLTAAMGALALALVALSGCNSTAGPETGADVEDVQQDIIEGTVDEAEDAEEGDRVTVSANVNDIISPLSFTIAGTDETTVDALLVIHDGKISGIEPELTVQVTGIVHRNFDVAAAEKETGLDLDGALHEQWQGETYIVASQIDTTMGNG